MHSALVATTMHSKIMDEIHINIQVEGIMGVQS